MYETMTAKLREIGTVTSSMLTATLVAVAAARCAAAAAAALDGSSRYSAW